METLETEAKKIGIVLDAPKILQFQKYQDLLLEWNKKMNLTAIREPKDIEIKHFLDSLTILQALPSNTKNIIDIGAGAGFPGIPLAIARPELKVTLIDATGKKIIFLKKVIEELSLPYAEAIQGRAEIIAHDKYHREHYDVVVARAVAYLPTLVELCLPFVKVGGYFIAQKQKSEKEIEEARASIEKHGGTIEKIIDINLSETSNRILVVVKKIKTTGSEFPRSGNSLKTKPPKQSFGGSRQS